MSKRKDIKNEIYYGNEMTSIIPTVSYSEEPKIKIYNYSNDGSYYFTKIGFNRKISDES